MDLYLGTVLIWAPNFAPQSFAWCAGQLVPISQNTALFSLLGTMYGGDGKVTFALPDLRSRVPMGAGMGSSGLSTYSLGEMGGVERVTLTTGQLPAHDHSAQGEIVAHNTPATDSTPLGGQVLANPNFGSGLQATNVKAYAAAAGPAVTLSTGSMSIQVNNTGQNEAHENRMPFLGLSYIICMSGLFPPRS